MITVLIADDHSLVRNILQRVLERAGDIQIVAVAADGLPRHCPADAAGKEECV